MSILTEEERLAVWTDWNQTDELVAGLQRRTEVAVLEKLKQQEPAAWMHKLDKDYVCGLKIKQVCAEGYTDYSIPLYATPVPAAAPDGVRGFSMWLNREEWGAVIDGLILERERSDARKSANSESTSNVRSGACVDLIKRINSESDRAMLSAAPADDEVEKAIIEGNAAIARVKGQTCDSTSAV